jgi:hypothetical protein
MEKELCSCGKMATWIYVPNGWFNCDNCICIHKDEFFLKYEPGAEFDYCKDGFDVGTDSFDIIAKWFHVTREDIGK